MLGGVVTQGQVTEVTAGQLSRNTSPPEPLRLTFSFAAVLCRALRLPARQTEHIPGGRAQRNFYPSKLVSFHAGVFHGCFLSLVHSLGAVLAASPPGVAALPDRLVAVSSVPHRGNHGARCPRAAYGCHSVAGTPAQRSFPPAPSRIGGGPAPVGAHAFSYLDISGTRDTLLCVRTSDAGANFLKHRYVALSSQFQNRNGAGSRKRPRRSVPRLQAPDGPTSRSPISAASRECALEN